MKKIFYLLPLLILSCSEDDTHELYKNTLAGNYRIVSITTDMALDINLDGVESTNYYEELSGLHYFNGKEADGVIMADLDSYTFQAEIRPSKENIEFGNLTQYVNFNFPIQLIGRLDPNDESSIITHYEYISGFKWHTYTFTNTSEVLLEHTLQGDLDNKGVIYKMIQIDENHFVIEMNLDVFQYNENSWVTTKATVVYKRYNEDK